MVLSIFHTFRTFFRKHDLQRQKYQPDIQENRIGLDVHQIQLQLVQGGRVVIPIDLRISGKPRLYFQAVDKFRRLLTEFLNILLAFRPGTHDAHIPF